MSIELSESITPQKSSLNWNFWIVSTALIIGLGLSIISWLEICVEQCSATHDYLLFGFPFGAMGVLFFIGLIVMQGLSSQYTGLSRFVGWMIAAALGAELMFIIVQKYQIGHWCPICLSIAACIAVASLTRSLGYFKNLFQTIKYKKRGEIMSSIKHGLSSLSFIVLRSSK